MKQDNYQQFQKIFINNMMTYLKKNDSTGLNIASKSDRLKLIHSQRKC